MLLMLLILVNRDNSKYLQLEVSPYIPEVIHSFFKCQNRLKVRLGWECDIQQVATKR